MDLLTKVGIALLALGAYMVLFKADDKKSKGRMFGIEFEVVGTGVVLVVLGVALLLIPHPGQASPSAHADEAPRGGTESTAGLEAPPPNPAAVGNPRTESSGADEPEEQRTPTGMLLDEVEPEEQRIPTGMLPDEVESDSAFFTRALRSQANP